MDRPFECEASRGFLAVGADGSHQSIQYGKFGSAAPERKATLSIDSIAFKTTIIPQIGTGITRFLTVPVDINKKDFANGYLYLSSFKLSQP